MNSLDVDIKSTKKRSAVIVTALFLIFSMLVVRLFYLQCIKFSDYSEKALNQQWTKVTLQSKRGDIRDRSGELLAISVKGFSCYANPHKIQDPKKVASLLLPILKMDEDSIIGKLSSYTWGNGNKKRYFIWLKRFLSCVEADQIRSLKIEGIGFAPEYYRLYPHGTLMAHTLGFVGIDEGGLNGVEATFNEELKGTSGTRWVLKDGRITHEKIRSLDGYETPPTPGGTLYLTIDTVLQHILEEELDRALAQHTPVSATAILVSAKTGDILAMASRPTFDPNRFGEYPQENWRNQVISDAYEMGSTIKPLVASAAIAQGLFTPDSQIFCENGQFHIPGRTLHDSHACGWLSLSQVIVKSSNIGMAKIGLALGNETLYQYLYENGFGHKTGVPLIGETSGLLKHSSQWTSFTLTSIPMGHEITMSPLQLVTAYLSLIGNRRYPRLVDRLVMANGKILLFPQPVLPEIYPDSVKSTMRRILREVVTEGTGKRAKIKGITIGGKTGTAQKIDSNGQYSHSKYVSSFIGFAPAEDPELCVLVSLNEPHQGYYGGTVAAPFAAQILKRSLLHILSGKPCVTFEDGLSQNNNIQNTDDEDISED